MKYLIFQIYYLFDSIRYFFTNLSISFDCKIFLKGKKLLLTNSIMNSKWSSNSKLNLLSLSSSSFCNGIAYEKEIGNTAVNISIEIPAESLFLKSLFDE